MKNQVSPPAFVSAPPVLRDSMYVSYAQWMVFALQNVPVRSEVAAPEFR